MNAVTERPHVARRRIAWLLDAWGVWSADCDVVPDDGRAGDADYDECVRVEQHTGLAVGRLSSLVELWGRSSARPPTLERGRELLELAEQGQLSAAQWREVAAHLRARPREAPTGAELDELILSLMFALPRGVGHAFRLLRVAATDLAAVPELRLPLVDGIRACLSDVDGPSFLEPIGLLDTLPGPEAHRLILDLLEQNRSRPQRQFAAGLATEVLRSGAFGAAERSRLTLNVLAIWRSDPLAAHADLGQLIEVLPPGLSSALARDARPAAVSVGTGSAAGPEEIDTLRDFLVARVLESSEGIGERAADHLRPMLGTLLRQALFELNSERRWRAGLVLGASPYDAGVASAVVDLLRRPGIDPVTRVRAGALLNHTARPSHVLRMIPLLGDDDLVVAAKVTTAVGHASYNPVADQVLRSRLPREQVPLGRARVYALGMTGSPGLAALAASDSAPRWQRHTARWWHENGSAITA